MNMINKSAETIEKEQLGNYYDEATELMSKFSKDEDWLKSLIKTFTRIEEIVESQAESLKKSADNYIGLADSFTKAKQIADANTSSKSIAQPFKDISQQTAK